jgi:hypothetical protein
MDDLRELGQLFNRVRAEGEERFRGQPIVLPAELFELQCVGSKLSLGFRKFIAELAQT